MVTIINEDKLVDNKSEITGIIREPYKEDKKCLFVNEECKHYMGNEHRCVICKQKCEVMPNMMYGINQFGELVELIFFTETE